MKYKLKELVVFLLLTFGISWLFALTIINMHITSGWLYFILAGCGEISPSISALVIIYLFKGKEGISELFRRALKWRFSPYIYCLVFLVVVLYMYIGAFVGVILGTAIPSLWIMYPNKVSASLVSPLGEELGWRGLLNPGLQQSLSPMKTSLIVGMIWGLWHLWYFVIPGSFHISVPFIVFLIDVTGGSLWYTWFYNKSGGSILTAILFHLAGNLFYHIIPYNPIYFKDSIVPYVVGSSIVFISGIILNYKTQYKISKYWIK